MAGTESCRAIGNQYRAGVFGATPRRRPVEKGNQSAGKEGPLIGAVFGGMAANVHAWRARSQNCFASLACVKSAIPDQVTAQIPIIPDHELLRVIGRGAYGEIWLARTVTGAFRAVKVVYRSTFESERAFLREFEGMSAFEPISRAHAGFINILHVGRTADYLYYTMELADDHLAGRRIDIG